MSEPQTDLFQPVVAPLYAAADTIQQRFEKFHAANPWVFNALVTLTRKYADMGRTRVGINHLVEVVRWQYAGSTKGDEFKVNDNFTSRYARLIGKEYPQYAKMFETRRLRTQ